MATTKHAQIRYKVLDSCFRNTGRNYTFDDLKDAIEDALSEINPKSNGIGVRTLREDIAFMESEAGWSADIERIQAGRKCYYKYRDPKFSINNQPLNKTELSQLNSVLELISRFDGMPEFSWVSEIVTKINNGFNIDDNSAKIVGYDSNEYLKGKEHFSGLFNAINSSKVIKLIYRPFTYEHDMEMLLHPYYLKEYNNRWFLFGLNDKYKTISNIAFDRIVSFETTTHKYIKNRTIDFKRYFEDVIGVSIPEKGKLTKIELLFTNDQAPYILTKPIHESQKRKRHDTEGLLITIEVIPNVEFERLIMSYGEKVKVLGPPKITKLIKQKHQNALNRY